ncbi:MAG TPA: glycosyltransferase [Candidatus Acidoferrum sp.]|nr:glycosyltransferase [Candidatus Acidoferrum sp.]
MRILALNVTEKGVGTYLRAFYFSRELARAGHDVTLMTVSRSSKFRRVVSWKQDWIGESSEPRGKGPWIRLIEGPALGHCALPGWGSGPLDVWGRMCELHTGDYDAVLGFEYHPNVSWPVYLTQRRKHYAFYSDWCDWFAGSSNRFRGWKIAHRIDAYLEEKIRFRAERVSVISSVLQERALSIGIPKEKVVHIPNGAPTDYIFPLDKKDARARFRLPLDAPVLVAVSNGSMCREVRIFCEVLRQAPKAVFLMVGNISRQALVLAEHLEIRERIAATGRVSDEDYPWALGCADVCICPLEDGLNDRARWPAKILDFLTAGRATVTNAVGEVERLFRQSDVGVLAGHSDQEFAGEIFELFQAPDRRKCLGELARKVMVDEWDWRIRGPQIAALVCA